MHRFQSVLGERGAYVTPRSRAAIAVIGASGRYPGGANNLARLWGNLKSGVDGVGEIRGERWDLGYHHPNPAMGGIYTRCAGLLDHVDLFDADFFSISPREATYVDPQQRLLLELSWEALEDAALVPKRLAGSDTGVFIGIAGHDYADMQNNLRMSQRNPYVNSGSALSIAANRISYFFDFHGPSFAIDTACSSALFALHQACLSLWSGECSTAVVGAVNMLLQPKPFVGFCNAAMISRTGRCRSFDAGADGYVRAEGGGVVVLKLLTDAERDGDPIKAAIIGSATNSDGRTSGLSLPNEEAQEALLRQVYAECGVAPEDVFYVEAHGTGTPVGDPIECKALGRVLGTPRRDGSKCLVGSIKSSLGHLETASGMAGLAKVLLALHHRELPPNLHFTAPNPNIAFDDLKLEVVDRTTPLPERDLPIVIGVSSYGFGGANAHVVISEYRKPRFPIAEFDGHSAPADGNHILVLSARSSDALKAQGASYAALLRDAEPHSLGRICATAVSCRSQHNHRLAVLGSTTDEIAERLEKFATGLPGLRLAAARVTPQPRRLAYLFSGNGPQWWAMGHELLACAPRYRAEVERIDTAFKELAGWSLLEEMTQPEAESRMDKTEVGQPALFALQLGILRMLEAAGLRPAAVLGHSVGEVAAAFAAGALNLEQAVKVIYERSRAQANTAGAGKMAAVGLGREQALSAIAEIPGWLELAAVNSGRSVTISGDPAALAALEQKLADAGVFYRLLPLDYAFHSKAMEVIEAPLRKDLSQLCPTRATIPFVSAVEGRPIDGSELGADYWWRNIRALVQFGAAINSLLNDAGVEVFLEIGPHPVLLDYVRQCAQDRGATVTGIPTLRRSIGVNAESEPDSVWAAIAGCYANGVSDLSGLYARPAEPHPLPSYPWQRKRFWSGINPLPGVAVYSHRDHPLLGFRLESGDCIWENLIDTALLPYLDDHVVHGAVVMPATAFIEMALAAAAQVYGEAPCDIEDFEIRNPLVIRAGEVPCVQLSLDKEEGSFRIQGRASVDAGWWTLHVVGRIARAPEGAVAEPVSLCDLRGKMTADTIDKSTHYAIARSRGIAYGPAFQGVELVRVGSREAFSEIQAPPGIASHNGGYGLHPCLLDACLQTLFAIPDNPESTYLPVQVARLRRFRSADEIAFCHAKLKRDTPRSVVANIKVFGRKGDVLVEIDEFRFVQMNFAYASPVPLYAHAWQLVGRHGAGLGWSEPPLGTSVVAERVAATIVDLINKFDRARFYREIQPRLERLAAEYATQVLAELGAREGPFTIESLTTMGGVEAEHRHYLEKLVEIAQAAGPVARQSTGWSLPMDHPLPEPRLLWRELLRDHPDYIAELTLIGCAGERIVPLLRGEFSAEHLFSPENGGAIEHLYDSAPATRIYNRIASKAIAEWIDGHPFDRRLRVLELGGGTGGLTANLLPILPPQRTDYVFSDISGSIVDRAGQRFSNYPFVRVQTLDIAREPLEQGMKAGEFEIIVAADVLHLAADVDRALAHVKRLLAHDGLLVLIEPHQQHAFDLVFGQSTAWLPRHNRDSRPSSTLLAPEQWEIALAQSGFTEIKQLSDAAALAAVARHPQRSVILALNPANDLSLPAMSIAPDDRTWLVLTDPSAPADSLAAATATLLREAGARVIVAVLGEEPSGDTPGSTTVSPVSLEGLTRLFEQLASLQIECHEIVHLASVSPTQSPSAASETCCVSVLLLVQAVMQSQMMSKPRLTLVSSMAVAPPCGSGILDARQAPLWGFGRVVQAEHPELRCRLIDLQSDLHDPSAARLLAHELVRTEAESEVVLTPGERYVSRLRPTTIAEQARLAHHRLGASGGRSETMESFRLEFSAHGPLDNLFVAAAERKPPAGGEVEIRVRATGINFRDVMWVMGMLPEEALENGFAGPTIGMECAGEIVRLGPDVEGFAIGDRVLAFAPACFASFVTTTTASVARLPERLTFEAAATIPTTFLTAYYALVHLARLERGERVLIHGAAGGVGMAAIQVAKMCGAEIFGTAGSPEKREILRLVGVDHVLDSRTRDFADEVMRLTEGKGLDVVLNSLAGEAIGKNFRLLKPFGRFLEIGKRDIYANSKIGLRPFRNNLTYFGIDADTLLTERRGLATRLIAEVMQLFERGDFRPLPHRSFSISRAGEAFRQMQQSRHVGKLVIAIGEGELQPVIQRQVTVRNDATYLISGGLGGFGLATARWLAEKGARHFALIGRSGVASDEARAGITGLEAAGVTVRLCRLDIADQAAVGEMIAGISQKMPPIRGVIHAAMVLDDGVIVSLDQERMHRVMAPKVEGAWNLHLATLDRPLDFFIMYSSLSTAIGTPGQANYVAANMYLEALAEYRRGQGLPALALGLGPLSDVGYLTRNPTVNDLHKRVGIDAISSRQAFAQLERLLGADATCVTAAQVDWGRIGQLWQGEIQPRLSLVISASGSGHVEDVQKQLERLPSEQRKSFLVTWIKDHFARVLGASAEQIEADRPLMELGLDSLMVVELSGVMSRELQITMSVMEVIQSGSINNMANRILQVLRSSHESPTSTASEVAEKQPIAALTEQ
jgi:acyl transferase domain-containing protein/NAD(P)-dependent dehydrogenase (short-subunit alcohol dehydrogenase family)/acyl carrier protein